MAIYSEISSLENLSNQANSGGAAECIAGAGADSKPTMTSIVINPGRT